MPWLTIYTDDPIDNPAKLAAHAADLPPDAFNVVADSWVTTLDTEIDDAADPGARRKARHRARQARYRARRRDAGDAPDASPGDARDAIEGDARDAEDAKILQIRGGNYSLPPLGREGVSKPPVGDARDARHRDARHAGDGDASDVTRGDADDWREDARPLTDEERARARAGLAGARAALRGRQR